MNKLAEIAFKIDALQTKLFGIASGLEEEGYLDLSDKVSDIAIELRCERDLIYELDDKLEEALK